MDEMIDRELQALREPVSSSRGIGDAVLAMRSAPAKRPFNFRWPLGIALAVGAGVLVVSLPTTSYAAELKAIAATQERQPTRHQKSIIFDSKGKPGVIMEFWRDGGKEAYRQFTPSGELRFVRVFDGKDMYHYELSNPSKGPDYAVVERNTRPDFGIETLGSILSGRIASSAPIEKKSGVKLNGRICDLYSLGKGHYRYWIDPETKLPIRREIRGDGSLWKRDIFDYPATFSAEIFKPYKGEQIRYIDIVRDPNGSTERANTENRHP